MSKSEEMSRWFLQHGSDPNRRSQWDVTPLSIAVQSGSLAAIRLLSEHGADSRNGQLLHFAMWRKSFDQLAIIDMLIAHGCSPNTRMYENDPHSWLYNKTGGMGTVLHKAAESGNRDVASYLLWRGASPQILDSADRSVWQLAKERNHQEILEMIEI